MIGCCFGLLGSNGAGKTTLISVLTGLYSPTRGHATICGFDLETALHSIYKVMGICPQFDILWPDLTIEEHLLFYARLKGVPKQDEKSEVLALIRSVDLLGAHKKGSKAKELSGGMQRRLSLAISLMGSPEVVFLDEPTTGLDPETKRHVWTLLDKIKRNR